MIDLILLIVGAVMLVLAILYFVRDCIGQVSCSMGGEMTFSSLWTASSVLFVLGLYPTMGFSRWWALLGIPLVYALSFPLRAAIQRRWCIPSKSEPTGFQKWVKKVETRPPDDKRR